MLVKIISHLPGGGLASLPLRRAGGFAAQRRAGRVFPHATTSLSAGLAQTAVKGPFRLLGLVIGNTVCTAKIKAVLADGFAVPALCLCCWSLALLLPSRWLRAPR